MYALEIFVLNRIYNFYLRLFLEYFRNLEKKMDKLFLDWMPAPML